jgi:chloramphenicol-sensitive protein RarD
MKKAAPLLATLACYLIWGLQPLYWALLADFSSLFILCVRILMSMVFTWGYLLCAGRGREIVAAFKSAALMKLFAPAAVLLLFDWGLFILAVTGGRVLDATLGYYMNPMIIFLAGVFLFREKGDAMEYAAVALACIGVVVSTVSYGSFPAFALLFAFFWPAYATVTKFAKADPIVSIAVETALMAPFALLGAALLCRGEGGLATVSWGSVPLLMGSGLVTALPMILYTFVVNDLPFKVVGILQYAGTTINLLCGVLFLGEKMTGSKLVLFAFIWLGLIVFTAGSFRRQRKAKAAAIK